MESIPQRVMMNIMAHFVGTEMAFDDHWERLKTKNFTGLENCTVNPKLLNPDPGKNGVCTIWVFHVNDIISWSSGGKDRKEWFLDNVETYINNNPRELRYIYHKLWPKLCMITEPWVPEN